MKTLLLKASAVGLCMAGLLSQNVSAQCAVTTGPTNDCSYGDAIDNFTIGTTSVNNSGCTNGSGYSIHTSPVFNIVPDVNNAFSANVGGNTYVQGIAIWIDLNGNDVYEASEQVYASASAAFSHSGNINIASTFPGLIVGAPLPMRVMCVYNQAIPAGNACTSSQNTYGETEDYTAIIVGSNVEATAVFEPFDNDCGNVSDSVKVTVTNLTPIDEVNVPVELNLTGLVTGTYYDTIPSLLGNSSADLTMAVINTQAGGTLNAELIVSLAGDVLSSNDTLNVSLNILDGTDLVITGNNTVCEGDSVSLSVNSSGAEAYNWYLDGTSLTTGTTVSTGALISDAEIVVESSNACRANDTLNIQITPVATASFTSSVNVGTVDFSGTATNETSVSWDFGDGNTGTGNTPQHTYTANGTYIVCFTATNSCGSVDFCDTIVVSTIGVDELFLGGTVDVYPNPTDDVVKIHFNGSEGFDGKWVLYDMDGKVLQSKTEKGILELNVILGNYPSGAYLLEVTSAQGAIFRKELIRK